MRELIRKILKEETFNLINESDKVRVDALSVLYPSYFISQLLKDKFGTSLSNINKKELQTTLENSELINNSKLSITNLKDKYGDDYNLYGSFKNELGDSERKIIDGLLNLHDTEISTINTKISEVKKELSKAKTDNNNSVIKVFKDLDLSFIKPFREKLGISKKELLSLIYEVVKSNDGRGTAWGVWTALNLKDL